MQVRYNNVRCIYYHSDSTVLVCNVWPEKSQFFFFFFSGQKGVPKLCTTSVKIFKILKQYHDSCIFCCFMMDVLQLSPYLITIPNKEKSSFLFFKDLYILIGDFCCHLCISFKYFFISIEGYELCSMGLVPVSLLWSSNPSALFAFLGIANIWAGQVNSLRILSVISPWQLCRTTVTFPAAYANVFPHSVSKLLIAAAFSLPPSPPTNFSVFLGILLPSDADPQICVAISHNMKVLLVLDLLEMATGHFKFHHWKPFPPEVQEQNTSL